MRTLRLRAPANVLLHRAQVILILATLVPTILTTPIGIVLLVAGGSSNLTLVAGILVLAFGASSVTGYIVGSILLRRGARLVKVQNDFLSSVSHELRTPMTSIRMFVEALQDQRLADPEERARCLGSLHQEIVRLDGLVARLIDLTRVESGRQPFTRAQVSLDDVVQDALAAFEALRYPDAAKLEVEVGSDLRVMGDRAALTQVVVNLLSNAWKHGGRDGVIRLQARAHEAREVELIVTDEGPGIPASEQKRVFEKFERGRAAIAGAVPGSGLGLAIVRAYVAAHRGRVELESSPEEGTSVHVFLPRQPSPARVGAQ